jgi:O-glycosyl hydrolase
MFKRTALFVLVLSLLMAALLAQIQLPPEAVVNWADTKQEIDGFGGSCADFGTAFPASMADFFFTTSGIGLSLLRIQVIPSMAECSYFEGKPCVAVSSGPTLLKGELAIAQQALKRGVSVWAAPWSPPAAIKSNKAFINGGTLLPAGYPVWANSLAGYVKLLDSNGVPIYALSVQNEPDITQSYGSATYSSQQLHDFVPYLHSALKSSGFESTKIMIAEASQWDFSLTRAAMEDSNVAQNVEILAAHGYGPSNITAPTNYGKHIWQTEDSSTSPEYDGSIDDGLAWATRIHLFLTVANVNAWHAWFLSDGPDYGGGTDNAALTDEHLNYPKRAYVIGQWSKFVRPGWYRIGVNESYSRLRISAFKDPSGKSFAIVAVNPGRIPITQAFSLNGFSTNIVTPWITSKYLSLSAQTAVSTTNGSFKYRVPGHSVVTFVGSASGA